MRTTAASKRTGLRILIWRTQIRDDDLVRGSASGFNFSTTHFFTLPRDTSAFLATNFKITATTHCVDRSNRL